MNYSVEIGTLGGNALGNAGMGECDPGNSVKIFTEGRLALQAATWLALGRIPVQASNLPIEDFVSIEDGKSRSINITDVWKNNNRSFRKMLRGALIYKGYGTNDEDFKG